MVLVERALTIFAFALSFHNSIRVESHKSESIY